MRIFGTRKRLVALLGGVVSTVRECAAPLSNSGAYRALTEESAVWTGFHLFPPSATGSTTLRAPVTSARTKRRRGFLMGDRTGVPVESCWPGLSVERVRKPLRIDAKQAKEEER